MSETSGRNDELESLGAIRLPEAEGSEMTLANLWAERPVAIAWLRHYA